MASNKSQSTEPKAPEVPANQATCSRTVLVCSKLPVSLKLNNPLDKYGPKVIIRGLNAAPRGTNGQPIAIPYIITEIDADFWEAWHASHGLQAKKPFPAVKSGAIWVTPSARDADAKTKEEEKRLTGLQAMSRGGDERMGLRKEDQVQPDKD